MSRAAPRDAVVVVSGVVVLLLLVALGHAAAPAAAAPPSAVGDLRTTLEHPYRLASHDGRTWVTGTYMVLASGRLRVSVRSDSARVRLRYRTAGARRRAKVVRVRGGLGLTSVPRGSRRLRARAFGTSRLRASATVALRSNPTVQDADGNGIADFQYDLDSDGRVELVLFDDQRNGRYESMYLDNGTALGIFRDQNEDGYFELLGLDGNRDGVLERLFYDADGDRYAEWQCLDLIGPDGLADTWVDTRRVEASSQTQTANELAVQNIVTLNQLRQLNPWSTGYIPYNSNPSLLR